MNAHRIFHKRHSPLAAAAAALLVAGPLSLATPARADLPTPWELRRDVHDHVHDRLRHLRRVPQRIHRHHDRHLRAFFAGRDYYRPHRHYHAIYHFPVYVHGRVVYRPYSYCDGELFTRVSVRPHFWIEFGGR